jgi:hypothetical protein
MFDIVAKGRLMPASPTRAPDDPGPEDTSHLDPDPIDPTLSQDPTWVPKDFSGSSAPGGDL